MKDEFKNPNQAIIDKSIELEKKKYELEFKFIEGEDEGIS